MQTHQLGLKIGQQDKASFALLKSIMLLNPANPLVHCHRPIAEEVMDPSPGCVRGVAAEHFRRQKENAQSLHCHVARQVLDCMDTRGSRQCAGNSRYGTSVGRGFVRCRCDSPTQQQKHLYERAIQNSKGSLPDLAKHYRQRRDDAI